MQKLRDGEPLGGGTVTAAQAFGEPASQAAAPVYGAAQPYGGTAAPYPAQQPVAPAGINPITGRPY